MREAARLRRTRDVQRVRREGGARGNAMFLILATPSAAGVSRVALSVRGPLDAVRRNRARRRARAVFASLLAELARPSDLVVTVRPPAVTAPYASLVRSARGLLHAHGLLRGGA